ncbi:MAG: 30S ribosomal protein S27ae [Candidatus Diapherotrites archaeon]|nr:30S ribosomal protein S27ae [Candidatus Diapherotrites archaeon]
MPKKQKKKTKRMKKSEYYELSDGKVNRKKIPCPKCGPGVFMAEHKDRYHCGRCGYTMMKTEKNAKPAAEVSQDHPQGQT